MANNGYHFPSKYARAISSASSESCATHEPGPSLIYCSFAYNLFISTLRYGALIFRSKPLRRSAKGSLIFQRVFHSCVYCDSSSSDYALILCAPPYASAPHIWPWPHAMKNTHDKHFLLILIHRPLHAIRRSDSARLLLKQSIKVIQPEASYCHFQWVLVGFPNGRRSLSENVSTVLNSCTFSVKVREPLSICNHLTGQSSELFLSRSLRFLPLSRTRRSCIFNSGKFAKFSSMWKVESL